MSDLTLFECQLSSIGPSNRHADRHHGQTQKSPKRLMLRALKMEPPVRVELTT